MIVGHRGQTPAREIKNLIGAELDPTFVTGADLTHAMRLRRELAHRANAVLGKYDAFITASAVAPAKPAEFKRLLDTATDIVWRVLYEGYRDDA